MLWGVAISVVLLGAVLVFMFSTATKLKVSKAYVKRIISKLMPEKSFANDSIEIEPLLFNELPGEEQIESRFCYHIKAVADDGQAYEFEARIFDPAAEYDEVLYKEQQKSARPQEESMNSSGTGMGTTTHAAGIETAQSMLRDQAKMEREDQLIQKNIKKFRIDLEIVKKLNQFSSLLPKIHFYDPKKHFVLSEYAGSVNLKDSLADIDTAAKQELMTAIVTELAHIHNAFDQVSVLLPARKPMTAEDYRKLLRQGLKQLVKANLLTEHQVSELVNEYYPVASWLGEHFSGNIRFRGLTPYDIHVVDNKPYIRNWEGIDTSSTMTNLLELLKDPITDISEEQEALLLERYNQVRFDASLEQTVKLYHLTSCHLLTIQLCYMMLYIKRRAEKGIEDDILINWDQQHFDMLFDNAIVNWEKYDESRDYAHKIKKLLHHTSKIE